MIWANAVSFPTLVASNLIKPTLLRVAPITLSPAFLSTGIDSPVSIDSSIVVFPSTTTPSTGIFSPGRTRIKSPIMTSSVGISNSSPLRITRAVVTRKFINFLIASEVRPLAFASRYFPNLIKVIMTAAVSKYKCPSSSPNTIGIE